jgi:CRP/FNR family transcriptional regulator, cyclic AMP receptor protein
MSDETSGLPSLTYLGDAVPRLARIRELLVALQRFADFDETDLKVLASYMRCFRAPANTVIITEGEPGDYMLLILEGEIEVVRTDPDGLPVRIAVSGPGKTLGEMSLIDGEPRFASCISLSVVECAVLDRDALLRMLADHPQVGVKFTLELLVLLNQRLRGMSAELMECREARRNRIR